MTYPENGHVESGGPAAQRTVALDDGTEVVLRKQSVGPMDNNAYLLSSAGEALLIDAANDADALLATIADAGVTVTTILTTHGHGDHWQALEAVAAATGAEVVHHAADADMIPVEASRHVDDGDVISFGETSVRLIHNPGHTPGSMSVLLGERHLFTGDTLFPGGPGRTTHPDEFATIMRSLEDRLFVLGDDTHVYPGHGDDTTIGTERPHLQEWRNRGW